MVAKISASASTGRHCRRVNEAYFGRTAASSTAAATHWRTATTPAGPSTGKASAAVAAPSWLDAALPVIKATPASRSRRPAPGWPCFPAKVAMAGAWIRSMHTQNA
jgi:hypothetical protein